MDTEYACGDCRSKQRVQTRHFDRNRPDFKRFFLPLPPPESHAPLDVYKRQVHCGYSGNPLYVEIQVWDDGAGFDTEDLPYLFDRFYRGRCAVGDGIGIGLALTLSLIHI